MAHGVFFVAASGQIQMAADTRRRGEASELLASIPEADCVAAPAARALTREEVLRDHDRRGLSAAQEFAVYERYGWRCQYCGRRRTCRRRTYTGGNSSERA